MNREPPPAPADAPQPSATDAAAPPQGTKPAALSRELSEFLIEFSIGVHRYAMYPAGHPSLAPVVENIVSRLARIVVDRRSLSIGVARRQLVVEGVATDSRHPVLSDLARRLHEHQLAAVSLARGTHAREVEGLLEILSRDTERGEPPLGSLPGDQIPSWEHVQVHPLGYDQLTLRRDAAPDEVGDRATRLWLGLARTALASETAIDPGAAEDARALARLIGEHRRDPAYDQVIVGYLLQLAEELGDDSSDEAVEIRRRMSTLIEELDDATLRRLVAMGGDHAQRQKFVLDVNHNLAVDAVMKVVRAAASSSGQTVSSSLTRMLMKLATHAEQGGGRARARADTALRENVQELIRDWELEDPNPDQYTALLDSMAHAAPIFEVRVEREETLSGPQRVLEMAMEVDSWGATVRKAVADLLDGGESRFLLEVVAGAPADSELAERVREHLANPDQLRRILAGGDVDEGALRDLVERMGPVAVGPLLDVLAESDSRSVRRKVFDLLPRMGPVVAQRAAERLSQDNRWFVQRNMLALLQRLDRLPEGFDVLAFTRNPDPRVRREAFALALRDGSLRERTLATALADGDERLVRMALAELQSGVPETLVPVVVKRVIKTDHAPEIRALGARVLGGSRSHLARDTLMGLVVGGRTLFGRPRLAEKSPEQLAALSTLARTFRDDPGVGKALAVADRSRDPEVRAASGAGKDATP